MLFNYLLITNVLTFIVYGLDKSFVKHNKFRISENLLFLLSLLGGPLGAILGMEIFRHKTKKLKFKLFNSLTFILWFIIILLNFA